MQADEGKIRRQIAWQAAQYLHARQETDWMRARHRAMRHLVRGWVAPAALPQRTEIDQFVRMLSQSESAPGGGPRGGTHAGRDRFEAYASLLYPLEHVSQKRTRHPEGDALYHSLQVFELARDELPYDEEFLLAALLHDVGKAIDPHDHVAAGLAALEGLITPRTAWLIENHLLARGILDGTIGRRARQRLQRHESFEELMLLVRCDRAGCVPGASVCSVEEALAYIRELESSYDA